MQRYGAFLIFIAMLLYYGISIDLTASNEEVAKKYCSSCHLFPDPSELDKKTWSESVLPNMGRRLGIKTEGYDPYEQMDSVEVKDLVELNIYPEAELVTEKTWKKILKYYAKEAPETLSKDLFMGQDGLAQASFAPQFINVGAKEVPQVTLLEYDTAAKHLFIGDQNLLYQLGGDLSLLGNWGLQSPATDIATNKGTDFLLCVGSFEPSDQKNGVLFPLQSINPEASEAKIVESLGRPVNFEVGDLNQDGKEDVVIASFGNNRGQLAWYDNFKEENVLSYLPGARRVELVDIDSDGDLDIVAMMSQAWEAIDLYLNNGTGSFESRRLLSFSPLHGISHFEMVDFDRDGHMDILLTNGDNWDYSQILKPYHGLTWYKNDGNNNFSSVYFHQMPGCSKALARDFDQDGDLDIAAIAFFSDDAAKSRRFLYLENQGDFSFTEQIIPTENMGRWLTMEVADINDDRKLDILLGSYYHNFAEFQKSLYDGVESFPQVMALINEN